MNFILFLLLSVMVWFLAPHVDTRLAWIAYLLLAFQVNALSDRVEQLDHRLRDRADKKV